MFGYLQSSNNKTFDGYYQGTVRVYFMQSTSNSPKSWIDLSKQQIQALLLIVFLRWTSLLIAETVNVQNSCTPMINWDRQLATSCSQNQKKKPKTESSKESQHASKLKRKTEAKTKSTKSTQFDSSTIGIVSGGVAAAIATIAGAPVFVTVGIMIVVGLMVKSVLTLAK